MSDEDRFYAYCNTVFCGWDFCISDETAADLKHKSLKNELQVYMFDTNAHVYKEAILSILAY